MHKVSSDQFLVTKSVDQTNGIGSGLIYDFKPRHTFASGCDHQTVHALDIGIEVHIFIIYICQMHHFLFKEVTACFHFIVVKSFAETAERPVTDRLFL